MDDSSFEEDAAQATWTTSAAPPGDPGLRRGVAAFTDERAPVVSAALSPMLLGGEHLAATRDWKQAFRKQGDEGAPAPGKFLELVKRVGAPVAGPVPRGMAGLSCDPRATGGVGAGPALSLLANLPA